VELPAIDAVEELPLGDSRGHILAESLEGWGTVEEGFFQLLPLTRSLADDLADLFITGSIPCVRPGSLLPGPFSYELLHVAM
jgi:hypothetical protein